MKTTVFFVLFIAVLVLFSGCTQQPSGNPFGGNPQGLGQYGPQGGQPRAACSDDSQCVIDNCYGCIAKGEQLTGQCAPMIPPDCKCLQGYCRPEPPKDQNRGPEGNQGRPQDNGPGQPQINANSPLPGLPENFPESKLVSKKFKGIEVTYFSSAIARGLTESGTDFFISLKNTGSSKETLCATGMTSELRETIPAWNLHFFAMQDDPVEIFPGEEKKLWYFASVDAEGTFVVNFKVGNCGPDAESIEFPVTFGSNGEKFWGKETSRISGTVKDEQGLPVPNVQVNAVMNCGRVNFSGISGRSGDYSVPLLGMEDINAIYLGKELACDSTDYYISVEQTGYEYYFKGNIAPTRKEPKTLDIALKKKTTGANYSLEWEKQVADNFGFFWVRPSSDWSVFAAAQSKHPPELNKPTNFYLFDSEGKILWKQPTGNECWGIAISKDGSEIVAGCHDKKVYAVDKSGKLLWTTDFPLMVRSACISNDKSKVLSGAMPTLLDAKTGAKQDLVWKGDWLRNCAFYQDDSGFIAGARELTGYDFSGNQKWRQIIGEFPMFLAVDSAKNVFASGKSRTFFSFDAQGNLRWKHRIPDHTAGAGAATPDGSRIALGTVGGMVYLFDGSGNLLWKRDSGKFPNVSAVGHNAVAISEDGKLVAVGTAPANCVIVFNENGTVLWEKCFEPDASNKDLLLGVTNLQISKDKKEIIAAYGDNYIRKFVIEE
ncbi:MAG: PQQ-binding-like beta-propeller repeat protein [Candidatus ainarchaeum sp.]|nr:PQQ-binding-like beta-propeller repeat protein [Candidatus ainarchaeum sp.]